MTVTEDTESFGGEFAPLLPAPGPRTQHEVSVTSPAAYVRDPGGNRTAFVEQMVREHSVALARTVAFVVLDRQDAADIAQDAFVRLYEHWNEVARHPDPAAWLYRVAINRARDHRRALVRAARLVERLGERLSGPEAGTSGQSYGAFWEPEGDMMAALRTLSKQQRAVAALHYVGDLSLTEIGHVMGISDGAVKSHLFRAHKALRQVTEDTR